MSDTGISHPRNDTSAQLRPISQVAEQGNHFAKAVIADATGISKHCYYRCISLNSIPATLSRRVHHASASPMYTRYCNSDQASRGNLLKQSWSSKV